MAVFLPEETLTTLLWPSESFKIFLCTISTVFFPSAILSSASFSLRAASCLALRSAIAFSTAALCASFACSTAFALAVAASAIFFALASSYFFCFSAKIFSIDWLTGLFTGSFETTCLSVTLDAMVFLPETLLAEATLARTTRIFVTTPSEDDEVLFNLAASATWTASLVTVFLPLNCLGSGKTDGLPPKFWVCIHSFRGEDDSEVVSGVEEPWRIWVRPRGASLCDIISVFPCIKYRPFPPHKRATKKFDE